MICNQDNCDEPATWRVFWPGSPPCGMCDDHRLQVVQVGRAIGCYIHGEPMPPELAAL